MLLLQTLNHPHIVQVLAYCVPRLSLSDQKNSRVSMVTELGETLGLIKLLQMPWEDRLRVSFGLSKLLTYLAQSPFGAVVLNDFRHQQFVLVDGELKLTDVDDVSFKQPSCETSAHCEQFFSSSNFTLSVTCVNGRCAGFNQRKNIFNAGRYFTSLLLAPGTPQHLEQRVAEVVAAFSHATWEAERLLQHLASIVDDYSSGAYMQRRQPDDHATSVHDFVCQASLAPNACTLSVFDVREAEDVCDREATCKAFVMTDQKTWTGKV
ncbi:hypothetical protein CAPTEDRAFT_134027 [Capitella teleta]|uniref:Protein kinase domain-containing protein n=1 Tax=Capitella teleta TaxID=283909 RepID=R7TVP0_CAPTE|nr:hypothetical protein CAPTEDRAFT_134027 [Capitella teleta]|eukprot:ELT95075.1 hypothetical protein CAPTEDRAFT_134027 [Capitella teleta]